MKKLLTLGIFLCLGSTLFSQVTVKAGNTLVYKVNEYDAPVEQAVTFESITPDIKVSWLKKNKYNDKGTLVVKPQAKESAINLVFNFPISSNNDELYDVLLGFMVSKKILSDLKTNKKAIVRLDCSLKSEELTYKSIQPINVIIGGKTQTVNCVNVGWGTFGDEMWILDNADMPIIVKLSAITKFELTEIK